MSPRLLWKRRFGPGSGQRMHDLETDITVVAKEGLIRFEVLQETRPPGAKRRKNDYVLFNLHPRELRTILVREQEEEEVVEE